MTDIKLNNYVFQIGGMAKVSDIKKYGLLKASGYQEEDFNRR